MSSSAPTDPTQMRIHVGPDGDVEFSVALNGSVDPSMVATMVAAVRAGIVAAPSPTPKPVPPPLSSSPPSSLRSHPPPPHPAPPAEPSSDPDPEPSCHHHRPPSPPVAAPPRTLSVRQIAAQLDADSHRVRDDADHRYSAPTDPALYDPVREFSSSPSLWLTAKPHAYLDQYHRRAPPDPHHIVVPDHHLRNLDHLGNQPFPHKPPHYPNHTPAPRIAHPDRDEMPHLAQQHVAPPFTARPIRMLSLPAGSKYDAVNDMYFGDDASSSQGVTDRRSSHAEPPDQTYEQHPEHEPLEPVERSCARRNRSIKVADVYDKGASSASITKRRPVDVDSRYNDSDHDRAAAPSSPYVQISDEDEVDDAWDNVEYVLTESYRGGPKQSDIDDGRPPKSGAWRLFSSIGNSLSKRRTDADDDIHQSTLAAGGSRYKSEKALSSGRGQLRRPRTLFGRGSAQNGGLWLEFSSPLGVERLLAEIGKVAKALGYQVWRRPGENKLRCIRRLNHRHEMHMVIFIGSVRIPEGPMSVVRLKRARGDRKKTEAWRYSHFYRELVERLQRLGIEISSDA